MSVINHIKLDAIHVVRSEEHMMEQMVVQDEWRAQIAYRGESVTFHFNMGDGWNMRPPYVRMVMSGLIRDYFLYKKAHDIEDFCRELWYDPYEDRERVDKLWSQVAKQVRELERIFTHEELKELEKETQS